jgi:hypothetical protein
MRCISFQNEAKEYDENTFRLIMEESEAGNRHIFLSKV